MKKADQVSGATIDVPDRAPPLGQFPYHGFWQQIYKQLPSAIETKTGFTKYDIAAALTEIENLANGPYKVIIGEKLWKIGALLSMNQYIPASGRGGTTLDYITESNDGGRVEIAAVCMEPMMNAILQRASLSGKIGQELGELESEYEEKMELMRTVGARLTELQQWTPLHSVQAARTEYDAVKRDLAVRQAEIASISTGIKTTDQLNAEIRAISTQLSKAERDHQTVLQQIHHWQTKLRNSQDTNNGNAVANATSRLSELNKANQALSQSIKGLGQKLMALQTQDTDTSDMKRALAAMQKDASGLIKELSSIQKEYLSLEQGYANIEGEMLGIQKAGSRLSIDIERLAEKISGLKNSQSDIVASNESEMVRLWVNHLSGAYWDAESYLFSNLRIAQEAAIGAQGGSIYMQKAVNASRIAEMEEFLTSIDTVSDNLDSDEVKVLEQIARLGTLMNYLPGTARIMALRDMSYRQRKDAYKNMIEEMLEFGVRNPPETQQSTLKIGPLEIGKSEPLNEVADLLEHLADTLME
jgi:predicted  nucleic acid-binding Zn-ribbon protein